VGEQFHPLFNVDAPSYLAFQQTPLQVRPTLRAGARARARARVRVG
tara:strand:+ start:165 stop:302 length:138 start_codon:yes stop_codon:yes gene_type:complete